MTNDFALLREAQSNERDRDKAYAIYQKMRDVQGVYITDWKGHHEWLTESLEFIAKHRMGMPTDLLRRKVLYTRLEHASGIVQGKDTIAGHYILNNSA